MGSEEENTNMNTLIPTLRYTQDMKKLTKTTKTPRRNTKGPIQQCLETLPAENHGNVVRCRKYRATKKAQRKDEEDELNSLEGKRKEAENDGDQDAIFLSNNDPTRENQILLSKG